MIVGFATLAAGLHATSGTLWPKLSRTVTFIRSVRAGCPGGIVYVHWILFTTPVLPLQPSVPDHVKVNGGCPLTASAVHVTISPLWAFLGEGVQIIIGMCEGASASTTREMQPVISVVFIGSGGRLAQSRRV